jgi:heme/copper-type cytochrome/quinol oxidase subunit 3
MTAVAPAPESAPSPLALPSGEPARKPSPPAIPGGTVMGMALVVAADFMILGTLLAAFFALKGGASAWPPRGVKLDIYLPTVVTVTAILSAASMGWAVYAVRRHDVGNAVAAMVLTIVFGLAMINVQWYAIDKAPFSINTHAYGTLYNLLLGYHMVQVFIGIVMLIVVGCRVLAGHFGEAYNEPVRAVALFWQFGNVAWLLILASVFFISRAHV